MKYNPPLDMKVSDVELINQLSQILENQLIGNPKCNFANYLAIEFNGDTWVYLCKPHLHGMVWQHEFLTPCYKVEIRIPQKIKDKINTDNFKHLLFELGVKK